MKIMNRKWTTIVLSILILTAVFVSPASADYNSTMTPQWKNPSPSASGAQIISPNTGSMLSFQINVSESDGAGDYILKITLQNNNTSDTISGFKFSDGTAKDKIPAGMEDVLNGNKPVFDSTGTSITYSLTNPTRLSLDVLVWADSKKVYNSEEALIKATLTKKDGTPVTENVVIKTVCIYPQMPSRGDFILINPTLLPSGVNTTVDIDYIFYSESTWLTLNNSGTIVNNVNYTLDFSNVLITINGSQQSYSNMISSLGANSPVIFTTKTGGPLTADNKLTFSNSDLSTLNWNYRMPFQIQLTDGFKLENGKIPAIDFSGLNATANVRINNRGPIEQLNTGQAGELFPYQTTSSKYNAESANITKINFIRATGSGDYIMANSLQYKDTVRDHFYYQELFRLGFLGSVRNGENVNVTLDIPENVMLTHVRLPASSSTRSAETTFTTITVSDTHGHSKTYNNSSHQINLSTEGFTFGPGEDLHLEIKGLLKMQSAAGGTNSYSYNNLIHLVGTTNASVQSGNKLNFTAKITGQNTYNNTSSFTAIDKYVATTYLKTPNQTVLYNDAKTVNKGDTFSLYNVFNVSVYPYYSAHRQNPQSPSNTVLFPNPVVYFSVPPNMTVKDVHLGLNKNEAATVTDINGKTITVEKNIFPNAGIWGADGGKLVEVKLKKSIPDGENNFWLGYNGNANYSVRLDLEVPADYAGADKVIFPPQSVLLTTWDPNATDAKTGGAGGNVYSLASAGINTSTVSDLHVTSGSYTSNMQSRDLNIISSHVVQAYVSTKTSGGYSSYNPANPDSYPELKAGSSNEEFKMYINNGGSSTYTNAVVYFILPKGTGWKTAVNNPLRFEPFGMANNSYKVYYTKDVIGTENLTTGGDLFGNYAWVEMSLNNNQSTTSMDELHNITAVKIEFDTLKTDSNLKVYLPFQLPKVGSGVNYGDTAVGQTLYYFDSNFKSDHGFTGAVKLKQSDVPNIMGYNVSENKPTALGTLSNVNHSNGTIPDWWTVFTYDDFTQNIRLFKVNVHFTPANGSLASDNNVTDFSSESFVPLNSTGHPDLNYVTGFKLTIPEANRSIVNVSNPGTYVITYFTTEDDDRQTGMGTRTFVIQKDPGTILLTGADKEIFWKSNIPSTPENNGTWEDYYKMFVSGTDSGLALSSGDIRFEGYGSGDIFDINTPKNYVLVYNYTDSANNYVNATVSVAVKYDGELSGNVTGNGVPVMNLPVMVNAAPATTDSFGYYSSPLSAVKADPKNVSYSVSLSSVPAGLKLPAPATQNGIANASDGGAPTADFDLDPVTINVTFTNPDLWVESVALYNSSGIKVQEINSSDLIFRDYFLFEKEAGSGWFESGNYYLAATMKPGYKPTTGSEFDIPGGMSLEWQTAEFSIGNVDLVKTGGDPDDAPLIDGFVWSDENRDSIFDRQIDPEPFISGAEVNLLNESGGLMETTVTDENGYYYFPNVVQASGYYVQVELPAGFNHASAFQFDQKIHESDDFKSDLLTITPADLQFRNINAGFYYADESGSESGGPVGNATVVPPGLMNGTDPDKTPHTHVVPYEHQDSEMPTGVLSWAGLILMVLAIVLALPQLVRIYQIQSEKGKRKATFYILAVFAAALVIVLFFLFYNLSGDPVSYNAYDIVLAVVFLIEILFTAKAYGKI
ncbi:SdrD B-like domain-containing protein [Methanolapillus ohkumae]|uniref:SD-repeat containing protein B domain-containing protein n=1 Tax=Methanolapillus ohkumae TaxID=3028298 RepID=A0AA96ZVY0_9EURY|nr:hypothetical protein MsAm2_09900 [Methanosarcinaceae archaeon Am2]